MVAVLLPDAVAEHLELLLVGEGHLGPLGDALLEGGDDGGLADVQEGAVAGGGGGGGGEGGRRGEVRRRRETTGRGKGRREWARGQRPRRRLEDRGRGKRGERVNAARLVRMSSSFSPAVTGSTTCKRMRDNGRLTSVQRSIVERPVLKQSEVPIDAEVRNTVQRARVYRNSVCGERSPGSDEAWASTLG